MFELSIPRLIVYTTILFTIAFTNMSRAENDENTAEQIGKEFHAAYKLNTSEAQYAYMSKQAALAHGGKSLEDVLKMCARAALAKSQYSPEDIRATLTLAKSLKENDEKVFTASVTGNSVYAAMQIHADILDCAMPNPRGQNERP